MKMNFFVCLSFGLLLAVVLPTTVNGYYRGGGGGCNGFSCTRPCYYCGQSNFGGGGASTASANAGSSAGLCNANCRALASCAGWTGGNQGFGGSRGVFRDVSVGEAAETIEDELTACKVFIEQYAELPIKSDKLVETIAKAFYDDKATKKAEKEGTKDSKQNGLEPSTFQCCFAKFNKKLSPKNSESYSEPQMPEDVTCAQLINTLYKELTKKEE